ncbi:NAD-dependent epimerase/dehydratase family protein [Streptomyces stelliscabiei]|uniref:Nucleoside-diphosphate-sugar epimerase n=1 Tax=Streptomyces stelliscabiei TaxID=146820 RepID=A0A8I0P0D6_9ACTN|nr:NAD-dependent epimerase/dehydratase family protein [Streptomyces stelliscabiei]KND45426.1 nucleoside-diphosphate sugar epimerase [Streptomyces stelliscabiei]MBE1597236.1 nucleoside-diphosphate-sugar epimerase [Streptomyces stelliscabiei]
MRIAVTGGAGFIGGHVVDELVARGHQPVIFDTAGRSAHGHPVRMGDVRDEVAMAELGAHVDGIIHLAACLGTQETIQNPRPATETNVKGGLNFLEAITQYKIPGVYIGVGNHWMNNTYSISKTTVERYVAMFNKERGTRCNIVRLVNAYGPRQSVAPPFGPAKVKKITPSFVCRALTGQPIEIYGDGEQVSDMVHVTDGAKALVTALEKAASGIVFEDNDKTPRPVEVGPADHRTVNEVAETVVKAAVALGYDEVPLAHTGWMRPGEVKGARVTADTSTLPLVDMSADTLVDLDAGIADVVAWYAENWLPKWRAEQE